MKTGSKLANKAIIVKHFFCTNLGCNLRKIYIAKLMHLILSVNSFLKTSLYKSPREVKDDKKD